MRYRSETPLVLKGLNVTIAGDRIGVVGRTGKPIGIASFLQPLLSTLLISFFAFIA